jgi:hypothetical protein
LLELLKMLRDISEYRMAKAAGASALDELRAEPDA